MNKSVCQLFNVILSFTIISNIAFDTFIIEYVAINNF